VGGLDTWSDTIETKCRGRGQAKEEGWNFKREGESRVPRLDSYNKFNVLAREIQGSTSKPEGSKEKIEVRKVEGRSLREVTVKIRLERINI